MKRVCYYYIYLLRNRGVFYVSSQKVSGLQVPPGSKSPSRIWPQRIFTEEIRLPYIESGVPRSTLVEIAYDYWDMLLQKSINKWVDLMPDRFKAVLDLEGKTTGF